MKLKEDNVEKLIIVMLVLSLVVFFLLFITGCIFAIFWMLRNMGAV